MKNNIFTSIVIFLFILDINSLAYSSTKNNSSKSLVSLKETILALDVTKNNSQQKLNKLLINQNMSLSKEIKEYKIFVDYLSYQIHSYCMEINNTYGSDSLSDLPCRESKNNVQSSIISQTIQTNDDKVELLENEFMNSLGDFDEMLLKEEELIAMQSRNNQSSSSEAKNGSSGSASNGGSNSNMLETSEENTSLKEQGQSSSKGKTAQQSEEYEQTQTGSRSRGKQKGSSDKKISNRRKLDEIDDDIVARQLKEAAENESNPKLKEKLWDEYYKYKKKTLN